MRFHPLSSEQKDYLELRHRYEGDKRVADRIKAVLLKNEGWKNKAIAQALRIHEETVRYYITDWTSDEKLKPENRGSYSKLDDAQTRVLERHLEETTYTLVIDICAYIERTLGVRYTVSGLTKWLYQHRFSYSSSRQQ
jgi:transposase